MSRWSGWWENPNHAATALALLMVMCVAALSQRRREALTSAIKLAYLSQRLTTAAVWSMLVVAILGLAATGSRGGSVATGVGLVVLVIIDRRAAGTAFCTVLALIAAWLTLAWFGHGRMGAWTGIPHDVSAGSRFQVWKGALHVLWTNMGRGSGFDAFADVYQAWLQPPDQPGRWRSAMNDPLEWSLRWGVLVGAVWVAIPVTLAALSWPRFHLKRDWFSGGVLAGVPVWLVATTFTSHSTLWSAWLPAVLLGAMAVWRLRTDWKSAGRIMVCAGFLSWSCAVLILMASGAWSAARSEYRLFVEGSWWGAELKRAAPSAPTLTLVSFSGLGQEFGRVILRPLTESSRMTVWAPTVSEAPQERIERGVRILNSHPYSVTIGAGDDAAFALIAAARMPQSPAVTLGGRLDHPFADLDPLRSVPIHSLSWLCVRGDEPDMSRRSARLTYETLAVSSFSRWLAINRDLTDPMAIPQIVEAVQKWTALNKR